MILGPPKSEMDEIFVCFTWGADNSPIVLPKYGLLLFAYFTTHSNLPVKIFSQTNSICKREILVHFGRNFYLGKTLLDLPRVGNLDFIEGTKGSPKDFVEEIESLLILLPSTIFENWVPF